jgi:hypothetical protein
MGFLSFLFSKPDPTLVALPTGSFTMDRYGTVLVSKVPSNYPAELVRHIGQQVLAVFRDAAAAQLPLSELCIRYPSLRITARELRGGALVFLSPRTPCAPAKPD